MRRYRLNWAWTLGLIPCAYFGLLLPNGPPEVEGCSGGGSIAPPAAGIESVGVPSSAESPDVSSVGTDGFFVVYVDANELDSDLLVDALTIEVTSQGGSAVAGSARLLKVSGDDSGRYSALVGWEADGPLAAAQNFEVNVSAAGADGPLTASTTLAVRDETVELAVPELVFSRWSNLTRDSGPRLTCAANSCASTSSFGSELQVIHVGTYKLEQLLPVMVAWNVSLTPIEGKGVFADATLWGEVTEWETFLSTSAFRGIAFTDPRPEYCVSVKVEDLRTGASLEEEHCAVPTDVVDELADSISQCSSVDDKYRERWCRANGGDCSPLTGTSGAAAGGSSGVGAEPPREEDGEGPGEEEASGASTSDADGKVTTTVTEGGCGCRTVGERKAPGGSLLFAGGLFALTVLGARARRGGRARTER